MYHARSLPRLVGWVAIVVLGLAVSGAFAQIDETWISFEDSASDAVCGVVNAVNADLIVLEATGEMAIVSGPDVILADLLVDPDLNVTYLGQPAGMIEYADDADLQPTVFWITLTGTVVEIDTLTGEPSDSGLLPSDIAGTQCVACDLIDASIYCEEVIPEPTPEPIPEPTPEPVVVTPPISLPVAVICGAGAAPLATAAGLALAFVSSARRRSPR